MLLFNMAKELGDNSLKEIYQRDLMDASSRAENILFRDFLLEYDKTTYQHIALSLAKKESQSSLSDDTSPNALAIVISNEIQKGIMSGNIDLRKLIPDKEIISLFDNYLDDQLSVKNFSPICPDGKESLLVPTRNLCLLTEKIFHNKVGLFNDDMDVDADQLVSQCLPKLFASEGPSSAASLFGGEDAVFEKIKQSSYSTNHCVSSNCIPVEDLIIHIKKSRNPEKHTFEHFPSW